MALRTHILDESVVMQVLTSGSISCFENLNSSAISSSFLMATLQAIS